MRARLAIGLFCLLAPMAVQASWFEYCELEGEIVRAERDRASGVGAYRIGVLVNKAEVTHAMRNDAYTDCSEHLAMPPLDAVVVFPRGLTPERGDTVRFARSAVDGFGEDGQFAGTSVKTRFRQLRKSVPAAQEAAK